MVHFLHKPPEMGHILPAINRLRLELEFFLLVEVHWFGWEVERMRAFERKSHYGVLRRSRTGKQSPR